MFDIKALRDMAGITQAALAQRLGITQVQISRYEANPGTVPTGLIQDYLAALGVDLATALARANSIRPSPMPAPGEPYRALGERIASACRFLAGIGSAVDVDCELQQLTEQARARLAQPKLKPRVLLAGNFDAGKSHLANTLLGDRYLPSRYQPETRLPIHVRHLEDRPDFIHEEVWIMGPGFDPARWQEAAHTQAHKRLGGNFLTLDAWASHSGAAGAEPAGAALAFIDAPLLTACELLDTPGSMHIENDDRLTEGASEGADLVIYCSPAKGFLSGADVLRIRCLAQHWARTAPGAPLPLLERFFFVATHADPSLPDGALADILDRGAARLAAELNKADIDPAAIPETAVRQRLFPFWSESTQRSGALVAGLHQTISKRFPDHVASNYEHYMSGFKHAAGTLCEGRIAEYKRVQAHLRAGEKPGMPWQSTAGTSGSEDLGQRIRALREASDRKIAALCRQHTDSQAIETRICREFTDRQAASQYAAARIVADLQQAVVAELERDARTLLPYVADRLGRGEAPNPDWPAETIKDGIPIPPNARGLALGSLAGIAGIGPMAAWASSLGPWGGYLVLAEGASSLGIGSAAILSAVSAIGGPVVLAAGLVIVSTVLGGSYLGRTWQNRLAQTIARHIDKSDLRDRLTGAADHYWCALGRMLDEELNQVERYRDRLSETLAATINGDHPDESLENLIRRLGDARTLLAHTPWNTAA